MVSPADLEKVEFSLSFRGYNGDQVDDYIDMVVKEFTELTNEYEKYKVLCERQNSQIKIMRERILELEAQIALPNEAVVATAEPETVVKTVVKTVVDEEATKTAIKKLTAEFKAKAFELYTAQIAQLEALSDNYDTSEIIELTNDVAEESCDEITVEIVEEETVEDVAEKPEALETVEEAVEETEDVTEETVEEELSPVAIEDEPAIEEAAEEAAQEDQTEEAVDDDAILSADEIGALCESGDDELKDILDELSGLFAGEEEPKEEPKKEEPVKVSAPSGVVQQSFDSLFITNADDAE